MNINVFIKLLCSFSVAQTVEHGASNARLWVQFPARTNQMCTLNAV